MQFNCVEIIFPCQEGALGQANLPRRKSGNSMTKAVREKRESAEKLWQKQSYTKEETIDKGGCSFLLETQKRCQNKSKKVLEKEGKVSKSDWWLRHGYISTWSYIPIFSRRVFMWLGLGLLGVDFLSQVTIGLYLLNRSPKILLKNNSSSFT